MSDGQTITFELLARAAGAPIVYVVDAPEHPLDLGGVAAGRASSVVRVPVGEWDARLTPWPAPGRKCRLHVPRTALFGPARQL